MTRRQDRTGRLHLYGWFAPAVRAVAFAAGAAGIGQFGATAALGDVAKGFGHLAHGASIADQAGLSGTELGVGLAVIRLASLGGLPLAGLADRLGRRSVLLWSCAIGLACTIAAAASPSYWWFVVIFACGRPPLSASASVAQVVAAEETDSVNRARAVALVAAAYGIGAGLIAIVHALGEHLLGFRGVFLLAAVPLALLPLVARRLQEPDRFAALVATHETGSPVLGAIAHPYRARLGLVSAIGFLVAMATGPANSFVFLYSQNVRHLPGALIAAMVATAGLSGLAGLVAGRALADRVGRRLAAGAAIAGIVATGICTYSGTRLALVVGYVLGIFAASAFAPGAGALLNELFPTRVRASVAGFEVAANVLGAVAGLLCFGAIADLGGGFLLASVVSFTPALAGAALLARLPETRGREPEELWPETP